MARFSREKDAHRYVCFLGYLKLVDFYQVIIEVFVTNAR